MLSCGCPPIQTPYSKFEFGAPCSSRHSSTSFGFEPAHSHNAALKLAGRILDSSPSPSHNLFATRGSIRDDDAASGQCTSHLLHPTSSPRTRGDAVVAEWRRPHLYRPSLFTGAACQVRHAVLIVLWLPPIQTHLASLRLHAPALDRHVLKFLCTSYGFEPSHSPTMQPSILVEQSQV